MPGKTNGTDGIKLRLTQIEQGKSVSPLNFRPSKSLLNILQLYMDSNGIDSITKAIENLIVDSFLERLERGDV